MSIVKIKRIYEPFENKDGFRILVDRLWPRGISKKDAFVDLWLKEVAPTSELRKWFNHEPEKFNEFKSKYKEELKNNEDFIKLQKMIKEKNQVTLLYSAKDKKHNQAVVINEFLK